MEFLLSMIFDFIVAITAALGFVLGVVSLIFAIRSSNASVRSANAAEGSADAAVESNEIAKDNLETYRSEIAALKRIDVALTATYGILFREGEKCTIFQSDRNLTNFGICAVITLHNLGRDIVITRAFLIPESVEHAELQSIEKLGHDAINLSRHGTARIDFLLNQEIVEIFSKLENVNLMVHLELAEGEIEPKQISGKSYLKIKSCTRQLNMNDRAEKRRLYYPSIPDQYEIVVDMDLHK